MAYNATVFNQVTRASRTISAEVEVAYIQTESTPAQDFYIKLQVSALDKAGRPIGPFFLTSLADLPDNGGTQQHPSGSDDPYASLSLQMQNWIRRCMEGDPAIANSAMNF